MPVPQLEGIIQAPSENTAELRREIRALEEELRQARLETAKAQSDLSSMLRAIQALRQSLGPLYRALRGIMGEIELVSPDEPTPEEAGRPAPSSAKAEVWAAWKAKLGLNCGRIIDALLTHGELSTTQLSITTGIDSSNVPKSIYKLNRAGLINKNGGRFSLKQI